MDIIDRQDTNVVVQLDDTLDLQHIRITNAGGDILLDSHERGLGDGDKMSADAKITVPYGATVESTYEGQNKDTLYIGQAPSEIRSAATRRLGKYGRVGV